MDYMADLCLVFYEVSILFSRMIVLAAFPPAVYEGSFFPTSLPKFVIGGVFDDSYSNRGEVES
jgi:hypothetical protein